MLPKYSVKFLNFTSCFKTSETFSAVMMTNNQYLSGACTILLYHRFRLDERLSGNLNLLGNFQIFKIIYILDENCLALCELFRHICMSPDSQDSHIKMTLYLITSTKVG